MLTPIRKPTLTRGRYAYHTYFHYMSNLRADPRVAMPQNLGRWLTILVVLYPMVLLAIDR